MSVICPSCRARLSVRVDHRDARVRCVVCRSVFVPPPRPPERHIVTTPGRVKGLAWSGWRRASSSLPPRPRFSTNSGPEQQLFSGERPSSGRCSSPAPPRRLLKAFGLMLVILMMSCAGAVPLWMMTSALGEQFRGPKTHALLQFVELAGMGMMPVVIGGGVALVSYVVRQQKRQ